MKLLKSSLFLFILIIGFTSCNNDDDQGSSQNPIDNVYENIVPEEFLQLITDTCNGATIQDGNDPPVALVDQIFEYDTYLSCSTVGGGDELGDDFINERIQITNFNPQTLECDLKSQFAEGTTSISNQAYFLGNGNQFSIFASVDLVIGNFSPAKFLYLYTGEYTSSGIKNMRGYLQSVEVPEGGWIYLGEGKFRGFVHDFNNNEEATAPFVDSFYE